MLLFCGRYKNIYSFFFKKIFSLFISLRNRERERETDREREAETEKGRDTGRGRSRLHAGSLIWDSIPGLQDQALG